MGRCSAGTPQGLDGAGKRLWCVEHPVCVREENYLQTGIAGELWGSLQPAQQPQTHVLGKAVQGLGRKGAHQAVRWERGLVLHLGMKGLTANGIMKQLP